MYKSEGIGTMKALHIIEKTAKFGQSYASYPISSAETLSL